MRLIRTALPLLLAAALPACATNAGAAASASTQTGAVVLQNRADAVRSMERGYPQLLRDARVTGDVMLNVTVDAQGAVTDTRVVSSTQELFSAAAQQVARELRFGAPGAGGQQVRVRFEFIPDASRITVVR